jgi:hypothetical protein
MFPSDDKSVSEACQRYVDCEIGLPRDARQTIKGISDWLEMRPWVSWADWESACLTAIFDEHREPQPEDANRFRLTLEKLDVDLRPDPVFAIVTALRGLAEELQKTADELEADRDLFSSDSDVSVIEMLPLIE